MNERDLFGDPVPPPGRPAGGPRRGRGGRKGEGSGPLPADHSRVEVALPIPVDRTFTYAVDGPEPRPGTRVLVPFRGRSRIGWVVGPGEPGERPGLRMVLDVLEEEPSVPAPLLALTRWVADYYLVSHGQALRSALPALLSDAARDALTLLRPPGPGEVRGAAEGAVVAELERRGGRSTMAPLRRILGRELWPAVRALQRSGILGHEVLPPRNPSPPTRQVVRITRWLGTLEERDRMGRRAPRRRACYEALEAAGGEEEVVRLEALGFSRSVVAGLARSGVVEVVEVEAGRDPFRDLPVDPPHRPPLTALQDRAVRYLRRALDDPERRPVLLHGITGSGKTMVYLELLEEVLRRGQGAIVLVPEIALTPQTVRRFRGRFGDQVAVLHSGLSDGERWDAWRRLRSGERRIAVGARSAVFAPVAELGALVVDEEHDGSYKQSEAPRYHARDVAVVRAAREGAVCVLGSATPALESWANALSGKFVRVALPDRVPGGRLPEVRVVDLRELRGGRTGSGQGPEAEGGEAGRGEGGVILSPDLAAAIHRRLERAEQVLLLLNRRGYSSFVQCRACGEVRVCPNCAVSLTYHRSGGRVVCHHCRHEEPVPVRCIRCGSRELSFRGVGTEQVERTVAASFPEARIARMDVDTTGGKWSHHEILGRVERGEVDILMGTQMIAKGLDFPRVTLVGVINADVGIHLPDFRAAERTFQLLSQVAGRAGRGTLPGEVIIQTSLPHHHAVACALSHDYEGFARRELEERREPGYPPHTRLANVLVSSPDPEAAAAAAEAAAEWVRASLRGGGPTPSEDRSGIELVGPAPAPIERLHGRWRWHFILRSPHAARLGRILRGFQTGFRPPVPGDVRVAVDRDPVALL